jgi:hypothetical protein
MSKRWGRDGGGSSLSDLLPGISQQMGLPLPPGVVNCWSRVVGDGMARHCRPISFDEGVLEVEVDGPSWLRMLDEVQDVLPKRLAREGLVIVGIKTRLLRGG